MIILIRITHCLCLYHIILCMRYLIFPWYMRSYSPKQNLNSLYYLVLYEHLRYFFPCSLSHNWVALFFESQTRLVSVIQLQIHPRWIHTYIFNFWATPTLVSSQKIQSQYSAVDLSLVLWSNWEWLGQKISSCSEVRCFSRCQSKFFFQRLAQEDFLPPIV